MIVQKTFSKVAPVSEASVLKIFGVNSTGFGLFIENQDDAKTIVYTLQESTNGSTWTDIEFTVNASPVTDFSLLHNDTHFLKVLSTNPYIRVTAYGDAAMLMSIVYYKSSDVGTNQVDLFESA